MPFGDALGDVLDAVEPIEVPPYLWTIKAIDI
jgi:hypothetical protein